MRNRSKQSGLTLTEVLTTMIIIALLTAFSLPAINAMMESFGSEGSAEAMINAALSNARAIAIKEHRYAGIRFQLAYDPCNSNPFNANQYLIFIIYDYDSTGLANGFRAVEGIQPIKLPENFNVMDLFVRDNIANTAPAASNATSHQVAAADLINPLYLTDITSFSIVFSPSGQMVVHEVRTRNRDGFYRPSPSDPVKNTLDDIFNSPEYIATRIGKFVQDDYAHLGLGAEYSRNHFVIIDKKKFERLDAAGRFDYINNSIRPLYVSPYTGKIISTD